MPDGLHLLRDILRPLLPYEPHDYQLEGVAKCLDGVDLLAVLPTGSGKTAYYSMLMLAAQSLAKNPDLCNPAKSVLQDPAMLISFPTISLEEEMEKSFTSLGLTTLVINNRTVGEARLHGKNLWLKARTGIAMILLSPEMLATKGYQTLMEDRTFSQRVYASGVDEVHLLKSWGAHFRPCFKQLGFALARMPRRVVRIFTTASLSAGEDTRDVCKFLGLKEGSFYFLRRSNLRKDIRVIYRTLITGLGGYKFPDLHWTVTSNRKIVIFCQTINLGFRAACYLRALMPTSSDRGKLIRLFNSSFSAEYNRETLQLFQSGTECRILIATDSLMVGVNLGNVQDAVIVDTPDHPDEAEQKKGRANRNREFDDARGIIYISKQGIKVAGAIVNGKKLTGTLSCMTMHEDMVRMIMADCKTEEQNRLYANPPSDPPCMCESCRANPPSASCPCNCSGCMPENVESLAMAMHPPNPIKASDRLNKTMFARGTNRFHELREMLYMNAPALETSLFPPTLYLPDPLIKSLLDCFTLLKKAEDLDPFLADNGYASRSQAIIWDVMLELQRLFQDMREKAKGSKAVRPAEKNERADAVGEEKLEQSSAPIVNTASSSVAVDSAIFTHDSTQDGHRSLLREIAPGQYYGQIDLFGPSLSQPHDSSYKQKHEHATSISQLSP